MAITGSSTVEFAVRESLTPLCIIVGSSFVLGVAGPFGTYETMTLPARLAHFVGVALAGSILINFIQFLAARFVYHGRPPLWLVLATPLALTFPTTYIVVLSLWIWSPMALRYVGFDVLFAQTAFVSAVYGAIAVYVATRERGRVDRAAARPHDAESSGEDVSAASEEDEPDAPLEAVPDAFREKLPLALRRAEVLSMTAEDHYLRVRTDRGEALILMGIGEAEDLLGPRGIRIHRSHWVARSAIEAMERDGAKDFIKAGGEVLPVARNRRKDVAELVGR